MGHITANFAGVLVCALVLPAGWLEYRLLEKTRWGVLLGLVNVGLLYGPWVVLGWASFAGASFSLATVLGIAMMIVAIMLFVTGATPILRVHGQWKTRPESLVTTGPYRFVRHPLYVGHALLIGGGILTAGDRLLFLATPILWVIAAAASRYEEVTRIEPCFGDQYRRYKACTPFLLPIWGWILSALIYFGTAMEVLRAVLLPQ